MDKKKKNILRSVPLLEEESAQSVIRSQLRKRFDLGGSSTSATSPDVLNRKTTRPKAPAAEARDHEGENTRPTIPTPRPRLALTCVARRIVDEKEMLALPLDHRAAFVLMHIDGKTNLRTLIDVTSMPPEEVVALVERLVELRAIALV